MKLTFLGLGRMGFGMASRLLKAGHNLTVYNRSRDKCAPLAKQGAAVAENPRDAVADADVVFTMLSDDAALAYLMTVETVSAMAETGTHVSMSTISPVLATSMADEHMRLGRGYVACPVFGRPDAAAAGTLNLCLAGSEGHKDKVAPFLAVLGTVWDFGEIPAGANAVKLGGNFMIASIIELLSEAFSLVENHGVAPEAFYRIISTTLMAAPVVQNYGRIILEQSLVRDAARMTRTPLPMAAVLEDRLLRVLARGWAEQDWTVLSRSQREDAGLL